MITGCKESGVFTAGARLSSGSDRELNAEAKAIGNTLQWMLDTTINAKKPIVAAVSGPGIGIGTTYCGLCDFVIASEHTVFRCPFMPLGLGVEGTASVTFPAIMVGVNKRLIWSGC